MNLSKIKTSSPQEIFDYICRHLLSQGSRCVGKENGSLYFGSDGKRCAAGCLMDDEDNKRYKIEKKHNHLSWTNLGNLGIAPPEHSEVINDLQRIHDHSEIEIWRGKMEIVAERYRLKKDIIFA